LYQVKRSEKWSTRWRTQWKFPLLLYAGEYTENAEPENIRDWKIRDQIAWVEQNIC